MNNFNRDILIIGTGITGSHYSYLFNKFIKYNSSKCNITIFDKASKLGGRITSSYYKNQPVFNLGFKYKKLDKNIKDLYTEYNPNICFTDLFKKNILSKDIHFNSKVTDINYVNRKDSKQWEVTINNNSKYYFDIIISTIPVPQLLQINGNFIDNFDYILKKQLNTVKYNSIFSLGLLYPQSVNIFEKCNIALKYDPILSWIYLESLNINNIDYNKIILHSTAEWCKDNYNVKSNHIEKYMTLRLNNHLNHLNHLNSINPSYSKLMRWKYANVCDNSELYSYYNTPAILTNNILPFIIAGDSVCGSNLNNCLLSSFKAFELSRKIILN